MIIGIRATVDFAFKQMLGNSEHTAITVHFLNAVLAGAPRITRVTILNPTLEKQSETDKLVVLDLLAEDETGRIFNVEMQTSLPIGMSQRLAYYASSLYAEQLGDGENYRDLRPVICICVLEKPLFPKHPKLHLDFRYRERNGIILTDDLQIHLVELSKSEATEHNLGSVSPLERWAWFFLNADRFDAEELRRILPEPEFNTAVGVLEMISRNPEQKRLYDSRLKFQRDEAARLEFAQTEALMKGVQIGQILSLQQMLGLPQTPMDVLTTRGANELTTELTELQRRLRQQRSN